MGKKLLFLAILVLFGLGNLAADPLNCGSWAQDAVKQLTAKGILNGFPDGTMKGDRAMTRWEMALTVARLLKDWEGQAPKFLTKAELDEVRQLADSVKDELSAFGVSISSLESRIPPLEKRLYDLERIKFYGAFDSIMVTQGVTGQVGKGTASNLATDWFNGRRIAIGSGLTGVGLMGMEARLTDQLYAGTEFTGYTTVGDDTVSQYWGVTPPFLDNNFTSLGGINPTTSGANNTPWTRVNLERVWLKHVPTNNQVCLGTYVLNEVPGEVLVGVRNPNINQPPILPFFGINWDGNLKILSQAKTEFVYSMLPTPTYTVDGQNYHLPSWLTGGTVHWPLGKADLALSFIRSLNEPVSSGFPQGGGYLTPLPSNLQWAEANTATGFSGSVGPQGQDTYGLRLDYKFTPFFKAAFHTASTNYNPDTSKVLWNKHVSGGTYNFLVEGLMKTTKLKGEFFFVCPKFDPMILPYPSNPNIPVFLPYASYYSNYYQLHDNFELPNNRRGYRLKLEQPFTKGLFHLAYENMTQVKSSNIVEITTPGFIEPLFPSMNLGNEKGQLRNFSTGLAYQFAGNLNARLFYYNYQMLRNTGARNINDDINLNLNQLTFNLEYPLCQKVSLAAGYATMNFKGHNINQIEQNITQNLPSISLNYQPAPSSSIQLGYRYYSTKEGQAGVNNTWYTPQTTLEFKTQL